MEHAPFLIPSFVVGVTGNIDIMDGVLGEKDQAEGLRKTLREIFDFLQYGVRGEAGAVYEKIKARLPHRGHAPGLSQWPGLRHTPMMVLTSLAPGADSIVAEVALQKNIPVRAPLPFPKDIYRDTSTFVEDASHPTEKEKAALAHFLDLVSRIGDENVYPVRLDEEISWNHMELEKKMEEDSRDKIARRRRYQAAGEYVASHCDLLLALWDDDHDSGTPEGAAGIVEVKLRGVTPELLPAGNSFTWANCGPVIHIYVRRRKNNQPINKSKLGRVRWLHPAPLPAELLGGGGQTAPPAFLESVAGTWQIRSAFWGAKRRRWRAYKTWQISGNHLLCRIAKSLAEFNAICRGADQSIRPLCKALDPDLKTKSQDLPAPNTLAYDLKAGAPEFFDALAPLVAARRCAADTSHANLRRRHHRVIAAIYALVFCSAVCLQIFSNWPSKGFDGVFAALGRIGFGGIFPAPGKFGFGAVSVALAGLSIGLFWWHRRDEVEERDQDYRALAEGLRVQIAWCMAGLYRSAAAHYLERQRNEMDWIRGALSSLSMPYHRWSRWFDAMEEKLQLRLLRWAQRNWLMAQAGYHGERAEEHTRKCEAFGKVSWVLVICSVTLIVALVCEAKWPYLKTDEFADTVNNAFSISAKVAPVVIALLLILWIPKFIAEVRKRQRWKLLDLPALAFWAFTNVIVPIRPRPVYQSPAARHVGMIISFAAHLPLAALLAAAIVALTVAIRHHHVDFPDAVVIVNIAWALLLLIGGLLAGWTEQNLLSEQAYQFSAMASLFTAAHTRMDQCLREAEDAHARLDFDIRRARIRQARQMLYDLGLEALDENAEWLILHRARPMEPMRPG